LDHARLPALQNLQRIEVRVGAYAYELTEWPQFLPNESPHN